MPARRTVRESCRTPRGHRHVLQGTDDGKVSTLLQEDTVLHSRFIREFEVEVAMVPTLDVRRYNTLTVLSTPCSPRTYSWRSEARPVSRSSGTVTSSFESRYLLGEHGPRVRG